MSDEKIPSLEDHIGEYIDRIEDEIKRLEGLRDEAADLLEAHSPQDSSPPSPQGGKPQQR
jgi:hypothetical protein